MLVISAHGDTNFLRGVTCKVVPDTSEDLLYGHMDNFAGVHAVMLAYMSGAMAPLTRIEITYGEEGVDASHVDMAGARNVASTVRIDDVVLVVDVTGATTDSNLIFEKCSNVLMQQLIFSCCGRPSRLVRADGASKVLTADEVTTQRAEYGFTFDLYEGCSDHVAIQDESDVYRHWTDFTCFVGVVTAGGHHGDYISDGDYNDGPVFCRRADIQAVSNVLVRLSKNHSQFARQFTTVAKAALPLPRLLPLPESQQHLQTEVDWKCNICSNTSVTRYHCALCDCFDECEQCFLEMRHAKHAFHRVLFKR